MPDYYQILEVSPRATSQEIKAAYKRMALKYHPDRNPNNPQAEEAFKKVNEAYQVLSDDTKRYYYDNYPSVIVPTSAPQSPVYPYPYVPPQPSSEPYKNTYDPANYVSDSLKFKIKIFTFIALGCMVMASIWFYHFMNNVTSNSHLKAAQEFAAKEDYRAALVRIANALHFNSKKYEAYRLRADISLEVLKNYYQAAEDYSIVIEALEEPSDELYMKRGLSYFGMYMYQRAKEDFKRAIQLDARNGDYYYFLALAKMSAEENPSEYCPDLRKAQSLGNQGSWEPFGDTCF